MKRTIKESSLRAIKKNTIISVCGLTLVELVIALALMAVASAGVLLSVRAYERSALRSASLMLQADLRYAQRMAVIEGRRFGILFDIAENRYFIQSSQPREDIKTVPLPDGVILASTNAPASYVGYLPRGTGTHGCTVQLRKGRYWQNLTINVSGGRVEIKEIQEFVH
jgi:prepilin-type N-terminal cleavage/methylation domain-containing protein